MDKCFKNENAINFLLYSYFGITLDSDHKDVLQKVIDRAYRDASSHVLSICNECEKEEKKTSATELIKRKIEQLLKEKNDYNEWHKCLCRKLCKEYEKCDFGVGREFTYGIAQKWVNMTMKYLYLLNSIYSHDSDYCQNIGLQIDNISASLHIPLDGYIFEASKISKDEVINKKVKGLGISKDQIPANEKWSKVKNYDEYMEYQNALSDKIENLFPIDWEGPAWIEVGQKRKKTEMKRKEKKSNN